MNPGSERSFSFRVKEELAGKISSDQEACRSELCAMLSGLGRMEGRSLRLHTENELVLRKCFTLLKKTYNIDGEFLNRDSQASGRSGEYDAILQDPERTGFLMEETGLLPAALPAGTLMCDDRILRLSEKCRRAFIRGAFLSGGSVSDPLRGYHFEIVCSGTERAVLLKNVMESLSVQARVVSRKKNQVVYVKEGDMIVTLLAMMGAGKAVLDMENVRVLKEMRNAVNRKVNCETANINKTVSASVRQLEDIRLIREKIGFEKLNEALAQTASVRLQYPEASLPELGRMLSPPVGKSGVNHRLRRLGEIAGKLRQHEEEIV